MDKTGYLTRPLLRAAYDRICDSTTGNACAFERVRAAEAFIRTLHRIARIRGETFDTTAERLGY
jgi:hypothetical protein